jgi:RNA-directed DNA polymerase
MLAEQAGAASSAPERIASAHKRKRTPQECVKRLQSRIVKAQEQGRRRRVKHLQFLLTRSHSAKVVATERVSTNKGKNTPGIDGVTWSTEESRERGMRSLKRRRYRPLPLRRIYIPKKRGDEKRPLGIPTMRDRAMQAIHLLALDPVAECLADLNSYGFRKERSCADAISQCFIVLAQKRSPQWVLEGDIKACFDRMDHDWLVANVPMDTAILKLWLKAGYLEKDVFNSTDEGTPQGGIISPAVANTALDGLEAMLAQASKHRRNWRNAMVHLVRYADDFIITCCSRELLENEVRPLVERFLAERGLQLSPEKTLITHIEDGFDFLGQNVRKYNGKLIIKPSKENVQTFLQNVRKVVKSNKATSAGVLICQLNLKIRGWAGYHRHICAKRTFSQVDRAIFQVLWQWAKRRHSEEGKGLRWIKERYFTHVPGPNGGNNWTFFGEIKDGDGTLRRITLFRASQVKIRRHVKIRSAVNPYSPAWSDYLRKRHDRTRRPTRHGDGGADTGAVNDGGSPEPDPTFRGL